jgi:hypothetical protein
MRQRGRPSGGSLSVVPIVADPDGRPAPPPELSEDEAKQWRTYTARMPPSWFPNETLPLLRELVQTITLAQRANAELRAIKSLRRDDVFARFIKLAHTKLETSERISQLSTKLRLTNQSRIQAQRASALEQTSRHMKPWEIGGARDEDEDDGDPPGRDWTA